MMPFPLTRRPLRLTRILRKVTKILHTFTGKRDKRLSLFNLLRTPLNPTPKTYLCFWIWHPLTNRTDHKTVPFLPTKGYYQYTLITKTQKTDSPCFITIRVYHWHYWEKVTKRFLHIKKPYKIKKTLGRYIIISAPSMLARRWLTMQLLHTKKQLKSVRILERLIITWELPLQKKRITMRLFLYSKRRCL